MKKIALVSTIFIILFTAAIFAYKSISFDINVQIVSGEGTAESNKSDAHLFQSADVRISPSHDGKYYVLESVTVNGEDVTKDIHLEKLELKHIYSDKTVKVKFKEGNPPAVATAAAVFV